jgi:formyl-CoA transferase
VLLKLLDEADVLVENFKAGSMEKWGLGYDDVLKQKFPRLIHCRITGFGVDGPLGGFPGYDAAVQATTGLFSVNGSADSGPTRLGIPIVDLGTGMNAVIGICMALLERTRSDLGQQVDITLFDTGVGLLFPHASNWFMNGKVPKRIGNAHPNVVPYDLFETATQPIFLAIGNNGQFRKALTILGCPELADDPRFVNNGVRNDNREELRRIMGELLMQHDGAELNQKFLEGGVPSGPALNVEEIMEHPHTRHRGMIYEDGEYRGLGAPVKLSRTPAALRTVPRRFAADNRTVLAEAGFAEDEIDQLISSGAVPERRKS